MIRIPCSIRASTCGRIRRSRPWKNPLVHYLESGAAAGSGPEPALRHRLVPAALPGRGGVGHEPAGPFPPPWSGRGSRSESPVRFGLLPAAGPGHRSRGNEPARALPGERSRGGAQSAPTLRLGVVPGALSGRGGVRHEPAGPLSPTGGRRGAIRIRCSTRTTTCGRFPISQPRNANPLVDYLERGAAAGSGPHPLFDANWYCALSRRGGGGAEPARRLPGERSGGGPGPRTPCSEAAGT